MQKPFFYDITLRDGNQSLKKPWNIEEKLYIEGEVRKWEFIEELKRIKGLS